MCVCLCLQNHAGVRVHAYFRHHGSCQCRQRFASWTVCVFSSFSLSLSTPLVPTSRRCSKEFAPHVKPHHWRRRLLPPLLRPLPLVLGVGRSSLLPARHHRTIHGRSLSLGAPHRRPRRLRGLARPAESTRAGARLDGRTGRCGRVRGRRLRQAQLPWQRRRRSLRVVFRAKAQADPNAARDAGSEGTATAAGGAAAAEDGPELAVRCVWQARRCLRLAPPRRRGHGVVVRGRCRRHALHGGTGEPGDRHGIGGHRG